MKGSKLLVLFIFVSLVFALVGCKSKEEQLIEFFEEMSSVVDANKDNCDKMGEELEELFDSDLERITKISKELEDKQVDKEKNKELEERLKEPLEKMLTALMSCSNNEKVKKSFERFGKISR